MDLSCSTRKEVADVESVIPFVRYTASAGHSDNVHLLVDAGAKVDAINEKGQTALWVLQGLCYGIVESSSADRLFLDDLGIMLLPKTD